MRKKDEKNDGIVESGKNPKRKTTPGQRAQQGLRQAGSLYRSLSLHMPVK
jgi:hypothetical protein